MKRILVAAILTMILAGSCGHSSRVPNEPVPPEPTVEYALDVFLGINLMPVPWPDPNEGGLMAGICLTMSDSSEIHPATEIAWMKAINGDNLWLYVFTDADTSVTSPTRTCRTAYGGPAWPENTPVDVQVMIIDSLGDSLWLASPGERVHVSY